ncbi:MAG: lipid II flippase MurJ, partial [Acidobacteriota bacterium]
AAALQFYALGLTAYSAIRVLAPAFYALNETRIPMITSVLSIMTNYVVASLSINQFGLGHRGLAMSVSAVAIANFTLLLFFMRRRLAGIQGWALATTFGKVTLASILMGLVCHLVATWARDQLGERSLIAKMLAVAISVSVGVGVFILVAKVLRVRELATISGVVRRRLGRPRN